MMGKEERHPVIIYKPQACPQSDESDNMCDNDFLICLQSIHDEVWASENNIH